jgi:hypothetical protein
MGVGWSVHKNGGWRGQLERTRRWHARVRALQAQKGIYVEVEDLDILYAFFQNCHHLREWLHLSRDIPHKDIDDFVAQHKQLGVARDIANGTKHFHISRPSIDALFSIGREYEPPPHPGAAPGQRWFVIAGEMYDIFDLTDTCMQLWDLFLANRRASSEHLYPGFSIFARDALVEEVQQFRDQHAILNSMPEGNGKRQLREQLDRDKDRLLASLQRILDTKFSLDATEHDDVLDQLREWLDEDTV